jgi:hypothetical protein
MDKIVAVTFDIADQKCKTYNALEWHNFIASTREMLQTKVDYTLEELFDYAYGDEFWFEVLDDSKLAYSVAFDLCSEEFVVCNSDTEVEFVMEMAEGGGFAEEVFWA